MKIKIHKVEQPASDYWRGRYDERRWWIGILKSYKENTTLEEDSLIEKLFLQGPFDLSDEV